MKNKIDELDLAKFTAFQERVGRLKAEAQLAQLQLGQVAAAFEKLQLEFRQKYELGPMDSINPETRVIVRGGAPAGVVTLDELTAAGGAPATGAGDRQG